MKDISLDYTKAIQDNVGCILLLLFTKLKQVSFAVSYSVI